MKREPRYFHEADTLMVAVPLANLAETAELRAEDFQMLLAAGVSRTLYLNFSESIGYVRAHLLGQNTVSVARFVAGARRGEIVHYRDGNRLNLRRENLELGCGKARMDCRFGAETREAL